MTEQTKQQDALRIGIAGLGRAGWGMVYKEVKDRPDIRVVAGVDPMAERTDELHAACGARGYDNLAAMLADEAVEVVVIATGSRDHAPQAIEALQAGKHVVVEKPMALSLAEADAMVDAARTAPGELLVRHNRRFDKPLLMSKQIIASGVIGPVFRVQLRQGGYQRRADWQTLLSLGGGQLLNWGPHLVDWAMQLVGGPAEHVWSDLKKVAAAGDAEDHVKIMLRGASGAVADIEISGAAAIKQPGWHVLGEHGAFVIEDDKVHLRYYDPADLKPIEANAAPPARGGGYGNGETLPWVEETLDVAPDVVPEFWDAVVGTIRRGKPFPITLDEARENMRVIDLARRGTAFELAETIVGTKGGA